MVRTRTRTRGAKKGTGRGVNNNFCLTPRESKRLQEHPAFHEQSGDTRRPTRPSAAPRSRPRPRPRASSNHRNIHEPDPETPRPGDCSCPRESVWRTPAPREPRAVHEPAFQHRPAAPAPNPHLSAPRHRQTRRTSTPTWGTDRRCTTRPTSNALELRAQGPYVAGPSQGSSVQPQGGTPACRSTPPPSPCSPSR